MQISRQHQAYRQGKCILGMKREISLDQHPRYREEESKDPGAWGWMGKGMKVKAAVGGGQRGQAGLGGTGGDGQGTA